MGKILKKNLTISMLLSIALGIVYMSGAMRKSENVLTDHISKTFTDTTKASSKIVYVVISQNCLNEAEKLYNMGWPWRRAEYGKIIQFLRLSGAKVIAYNSLFSEKSVYRSPNENSAEITEDDRLFAEAIKKSDNVVLSYMFYTNKRNRPIISKILTHTAANIKSTPAKGQFIKASNVLLPLEIFLHYNISLGNGNSFIDEDNTFRRVPLFIEYNNKFYPSLGIETLIKSLGITEVDFQGNKIIMAGKTIPFDSNGCARLKFYGSNDIYSDYYFIDILKVYYSVNLLYEKYSSLLDVPAVSYKDLFKNPELLTKIRARVKEEFPNLVLEASEKLLDKLCNGAFKNKYIIMGSIVPGHFDHHATIFNKQEAGVHIHATLMDNFFNDDFLIEFRENYSIFAGITLASLIISFLSTILSVKKGLLITILSSLCIYLSAVLLFIFYNYIIDFLTIILSVYLNYSFIMILNYVNIYKQLNSYALELEVNNKELKRLTTQIHNSLKNKIESVRNYLYNYLKSKNGYDEDLDNIAKLLLHCSTESKNILFVIKNQDCRIKYLIQEIELQIKLSLPLAEIKYTVIKEGITDKSLKRTESLQCFLDIHAEILNNIVKHSFASFVQFSFHQTVTELKFEVKENGVGFDLSKEMLKNNSYGLEIINECAKSGNINLTIHSERGKGTVITLIIPIQ